MSTVRSSPYAFPHEVARYLAIEAADVKRLVKLDGMPATAIPKATRTVLRIYLPDFHAWLVRRSKNPGSLAIYPEFLAEFERTARVTASAGEKEQF